LLLADINMSLIIILIIAAAAILLALGLAYLPMRILMAQIAKNVTAPIRELIARQRDRRQADRSGTDRRNKQAPDSPQP